MSAPLPKDESDVPAEAVRKQVNGTQAWFDKLSPAQQAAYLERYPSSQFKKVDKKD